MEREEITHPRSYKLIARKYNITEAEARAKFKIKSYRKKDPVNIIQTTLDKVL